MRTTTKAVICSAAFLGLGGCQSVLSNFGLSQRGSSGQSGYADIDRSHLQLGRAALESGSPGTAIHHFERAMLDPNQAPDAYNGMGVAYAQLGRRDLSERFFQVALMMRPDDLRISRNLTRLAESSQQITDRMMAKSGMDPDLTIAATETDRPVRVAGGNSRDLTVNKGRVVVDNRRATVSRISDREVRIGAAEPEIIADDRKQSGATVGPAMQPRPRTPAHQGEPSGALMTKASASLDQSMWSIYLAQHGCNPSAAPGASKTEYPIRVSLKRSGD